MPSITYSAADKLGELRAQIADLADQAKAIEGFLKGQGVGAYRGGRYEVTVSRCERATTNWKGVVSQVLPALNAELIEAHTRKVDFDRVTVTARKKAS